MKPQQKLNRMEIAGSMGDLGTLLPIAIAMVLINGLNPVGLFFSIGLFYVVSGLFFKVTVPVQPMKVIGSYAIAMSLSSSQIMASSLLIGGLLLVIGMTNAIGWVQRFIPKPVIRGVQLSTGVLLLSGGVKLIIGKASFQQIQATAEPYLTLQQIGPLPIGVLLGIGFGLITLLFIESRRFPSGLIVLSGGLLVGLLLRDPAKIDAVRLHFTLPPLFGLPVPSAVDFNLALFGLVLPQLPMTLGNAVMAYTDLSKKYFQEKSNRVTNRNACLSMGIANIFSFCLGGMPMCHGAGGLAAHYRFGARTAISNYFIGALFLALAVFLGEHIMGIVTLLPMSILGVLLIFAGLQLTLTIMDLTTRKDYFVTIMILGITLTVNMAVGFLIGILLAHLIKWERLAV